MPEHDSTPMAPRGGGPLRSRRRRWALRAGYLLFLALLAEAGAYVAFRVAAGEFYTAEHVREQQEWSANLVTRGGAVPSPARGPDFLRGEAVHPYVGFLPVFIPRYALDDGLWLSQEALYQPDSPLFRRDARTLLVGITGGSVAAYFTRFGRETLARELERDPRYAGRDVRFVAMAGGGFKQPQQLMALAWLLSLGGSLDVLVDIDGFNEVALHEPDNGFQHVYAAYPRAWYFRVPPESLALPLVGEIAYLRHRRAEIAQAALASPLRWSWVHKLVWKVRDKTIHETVRERGDSLRSYVPHGEETILTGPERVYADADDLYDELVRFWESGSRQMHYLCVANGIRYVHALQPNQYLRGSKPLSDEERETAYREDHVYARGAILGYPRLVAAGAHLAAEGVPFLDLTRLFADVTETVYVDDCCHVNQLGNDMMAEAIARFLLAED